MGMQAVNTGLEVQLEPSNPSPSWQVETPSWGVFVWKGNEGPPHLPSLLFKAKASFLPLPLGRLSWVKRDK